MLWHGNNRDIESKIHNDFVDKLRMDNIKVVDMRPIFEATGKPLQFSYTHNGHWNNEGHQRAAEAIYRYLLKNNIWGVQR